MKHGLYSWVTWVTLYDVVRAGTQYPSVSAVATSMLSPMRALFIEPQTLGSMWMSFVIGRWRARILRLCSLNL